VKNDCGLYFSNFIVITDVSQLIWLLGLIDFNRFTNPTFVTTNKLKISKHLDGTLLLNHLDLAK